MLRYSTLLIIIVSIVISGVYSCKHSPVIPVGGIPIDTTTGGGTGGTGGGGGNAGNPCHPDTIYFFKDVLPILVSNCAKSGCHDAVTHEEDLILTSYDQVMN